MPIYEVRSDLTGKRYRYESDIDLTDNDLAGLLDAQEPKTPSGKLAVDETGEFTRDYYEEVHKKSSVWDAAKEGGKQLAEGLAGTFIPHPIEAAKTLGIQSIPVLASLAQGEYKKAAKQTLTAAESVEKANRPKLLKDAGIATLPEAILAATEDYTMLAGAAKDQLVDKAGRLIGMGEDWERQREYERWKERGQESKRQEGGKSRVGDALRLVGADDLAKKADEQVNQEAANALSLALDPAFLLSGGTGGALRKLATLPIKGASAATKAGIKAVAKGTLGAEKAAALAKDVTKLSEKIGENVVVKGVSNTTKNIINSPVGATLSGLGRLSGVAATGMEKVVSPTLMKFAENPVKTAIGSGIISGISSGDISTGVMTGVGVAAGLRPSLITGSVGKAGRLTNALRVGEEVLKGTGEAIGKGVGRRAFIDISGRTANETAANILKSAAGVASKEGKTLMGAPVWLTDKLARYAVDPAIRGATVGGAMGYAIEGTPQGAAMMAGQGIVAGPLGNLADKPIGALSRLKLVKDRSGKLRPVILQDPKVYEYMKQNNEEWLNSLPQESRDAIKANRPDEGVLYKIADAHVLSTGQGAKEGTAEQAQYNVYRQKDDYNAIHAATGGENTAGSSQTVSQALANAKNALETTTDAKAKKSLEAFIKEVEGYGAQAIKNPQTGKFEAGVNGSKRTLNLKNTSANEFQNGSNVFHEILGHGTIALSGEEGSALGERLSEAKRRVMEALIGIRDASGKLVVDANGKPIKAGMFGENLEQAILDYARNLPEEVKAAFLEKTRGKSPDEIAEEMFAEGASAFAREAPLGVRERSAKLAKPTLLDRLSNKLDLRNKLERMGVVFIDHLDFSKGRILLDKGESTIFRDKDGNPMKLNDELRQAYAELFAAQMEANERLKSERKQQDPTRTIAPEEIKTNPSVAQDLASAGIVASRQKTSVELAIEARDIFRAANNGKDPTPDELKATLDQGLADGSIEPELPLYTPKGEPVINKPKDIKKADKERSESIFLALDSMGTETDPNALHKKEGADGKPYYTGTYLSENQLRAIEGLSDKLVSRRMKRYLRTISEHLRDPSKKGTPFEIAYYAATEGGKYSSGISQSLRLASPTSMSISKARNFNVNFFDHSRFAAALREAVETKPNFLKLWGDVDTQQGKMNAVDRFMQAVDLYLKNHEQELPGRTGLHKDEATAQKMAKTINDFFNITDKDWKHNKAGEFPENQFYRKLRIDRVGNMAKGDIDIFGKRDVRLPIDLQRQKQAFMPAVQEVRGEIDAALPENQGGSVKFMPAVGEKAQGIANYLGEVKIPRDYRSLVDGSGKLAKQNQFVDPNKVLQTETPDQSSVDSIKQVLLSGDDLPPVVVERDAEGLFVVDGNSRVQAAKELGLKQIPVREYGDLSETISKFMPASSEEIAEASTKGMIEFKQPEIRFQPTLVKPISEQKAKALGISDDWSARNLVASYPQAFNGVSNAAQYKERVEKLLNYIKDEALKPAGIFHNKSIDENRLDAMAAQLAQGGNERLVNLARTIRDATGDQKKSYAEQLLQETRKQQSEIFKEWIDYVGTGGYSPSEQVMLLNSAFRERAIENPDGSISIINLGGKSERLPISPDPAVAGAVIGSINNAPQQKRISELWSNASKEISEKRKQQREVVKTETNDGERGQWIYFPSKENDPDNFNQNVSDLETLAATSSKFGKCSWCTGEGSARGQLANGDFWIYEVDGNARAAVRMDGNNEIGEIRGVLEGQGVESSMVKPLLSLIKEKDFSGGEGFVENLFAKQELINIDKKLGNGEIVSTEQIKKAARKVALTSGDYRTSGNQVRFYLKDDILRQEDASLKEYPNVQEWMSTHIDLASIPKGEKIFLEGNITIPLSDKQKYQVEAGKTAYFEKIDGSLTLNEGASAPNVINVGGSLTLYKGASAPNLTRVKRNLILYEGASAPNVTSVGGDLSLDKGASAPNVTSVGGNLNLDEGASAPNLTSVGGNKGKMVGNKFIPDANQPKFMPSTKQDAAYLKAAEAGDIETAQKMVDEAARGAGYSSKPLIHRTDSRFTKFDADAPVKHRKGDISAFYFSDPSADVQAGYKGSRIVKAYLPEGLTDISSRMKDLISSGKTFNEAKRIAMLEVKDSGGVGTHHDGLGNNAPEFAVFDPSQIKSADPITYDDSGRIIPLSERFNEKKDDIRYMPSENFTLGEKRGIVPLDENDKGGSSSVDPNRQRRLPFLLDNDARRVDESKTYGEIAAALQKAIQSATSQEGGIAASQDAVEAFHLAAIRLGLDTQIDDSGNIVKPAEWFRAVYQEAISAPAEKVISLKPEEAVAPMYYMPSVSDIGFYSQVEANAEKLPERFTVGQLKAAMSPEKGVKPDELVWTGFDDFLAGKKPEDKMTKAEVQKWISENKVEVREVVKGNKKRVFPKGWNVEQMDKEAAEIFGGNEGDWLLLDQNGNDVIPLGPHASAELAKNAALDSAIEADIPLEHFGGESDDLKFSQYQIPGGSEYKELLLTLPDNRNRNSELEDWKRQATKKYGEGWTRRQLTKYELDRLNELENISGRPQESFLSTHFSEPNILVHVRFNERKGPNGEKILFIEEVQSDWHQKGRKEGYKTKEKNQELAASKKELSEILPKVNEAIRAMDNLGFDHISQARGAIVEDPDFAVQFDIDAKYLPLLNRYRELSVIRDNANSVPDAPFKKTWHELAMKRMLRYAAENGYDTVAWTTGEMQAARYDLSKQVGLISAVKEPDGKYLTYIEGKDGTRLFRNVNGFNDYGQKKMTADELESTIGKEAAQKIVAGTERGPKDKNGWFDLRGDDLKVGGEGMKGFYDKILPSTMDKLGKKFGMKTGETKISVPQTLGAGDGGRLKYEIFDEAGSMYDAFPTKELAEQALKNLGEGYTMKSPDVQETMKVHSIDLTPQAKEGVSKGQPLFMPASRIESFKSGKEDLILNKLDKKSGQRLVKVDVNKIDDNFSKDSNFYIGAGGDGGIKKRYEDFGKFINEGLSIEAPSITIDENGSVRFSNGRHRWAFLRDNGIKSLSVAMDAESRKNAEKFGYLSGEGISNQVGLSGLKQTVPFKKKKTLGSVKIENPKK